MSAAAWCATLVLASVLCTGCAGFRGGWESVAYLGESPPAADAPAEGRARTPPELDVPGLKLRVTIDNELRTYDTQVYLFALPLSIDPRDVHVKNVESGKTRVFVTATPEAPGFVFRPAAAVLQVGAERFRGAAGFEFDRWDEAWNRVEEGGRWDHRPVDGAFTLSEAGRRYYLSIDFATPLPSPESPDIAVDLSQARRSAMWPPLPLIRFAPVRWKEGYTRYPSTGGPTARTGPGTASRDGAPASAEFATT